MSKLSSGVLLFNGVLCVLKQGRSFGLVIAAIFALQ